MTLILTKDTKDKTSLEIFKGNLIPVLPVFCDHQQYIDTKGIGLSGNFKGSTILKVENLPKLEVLGISFNNTLANLEVRNLRELKKLWVMNNAALTNLPLRNLRALELLVIAANNKLDNLGIKKLPLLIEIWVKNRAALTTLTLRDLRALEFLAYWSNNHDLRQVATSPNGVEQAFNYDRAINHHDGDEIFGFKPDSDPVTKPFKMKEALIGAQLLQGNDKRTINGEVYSLRWGVSRAKCRNRVIDILPHKE